MTDTEDTAVLRLLFRDGVESRFTDRLIKADPPPHPIIEGGKLIEVKYTPAGFFYDGWVDWSAVVGYEIRPPGNLAAGQDGIASNKTATGGQCQALKTDGERCTFPTQPGKYGCERWHSKFIPDEESSPDDIAYKKRISSLTDEFSTVVTFPRQNWRQNIDKIQRWIYADGEDDSKGVLDRRSVAGQYLLDDIDADGVEFVSLLEK